MPALSGVRRNFLALLSDAAGFPLGMSFLSMQVILPGFLGQLGAGNVLIGLVPALANLGIFLPPLLMAAWVERRAYLKMPLFWLATAERVPFLLLAISTWVLGGQRAGLVLLLFFTFWGANNLAMGFNLPLYLALVAKTSLPTRRGLLFGLGGAIGGLLGTLGAVFSRGLLLHYGFPTGYALCFATGFTVLTLSILPFPFMDEPRHEPAADAPRLSAHLRSLPQVLREDRGFARYILAQGSLILATVAAGFYAASATRVLGAGPGQLGTYNTILMGTASLAGLTLGFLADRRGHRAVLEIAGLAAAFAAIAALFSPSLPSLMLWVFFLTALANAGLSVSSFSIVLEFSGAARAATYSALAMGLTVPLRFGAPLLAGLAADRLGYGVVFLTSAIFGLISVGLLSLGVPEPRARVVTGQAAVRS